MTTEIGREKTVAGSQSGREATFLRESAFPPTLSTLEVTARFWGELKRLLPADELHVIDPYVLDAGGHNHERYAATVAGLLKPVLLAVTQVIFVHDKPRDGVSDLIRQHIAMLSPSAQVSFHRGADMHARYLVADRARALRMEFSFNRIGQHFGTISLVENSEDLEGILAELARLLSNRP